MRKERVSKIPRGKRRRGPHSSPVKKEMHSNGEPLVEIKDAPNKGECVTLTEARENDEVCGIEVAPAVMKEHISVSTTVTAGGSGSWSLSSHSNSDESVRETRDDEDRHKPSENPIFLSRSSLVSFSVDSTSSPVYERRAPTRRNRLKAIQRKRATTASAVSSNEEIIYIPCQENCFPSDEDDGESVMEEIYTTPQQTKSDAVQKTEPGEQKERALVVGKSVGPQLPSHQQKDIEIINVVEPHPDPRLSHMFTQSHKILQQIRLDTTAMSTVLESLKTSHSNSMKITARLGAAGPFASFDVSPSDLSHLLSFEANQHQKHISNSSEPPSNSLGELLGIREDLILKTVDRFALTNTAPELVADSPENGKPGDFQVVLKSWAQLPTTKKVSNDEKRSPSPSTRVGYADSMFSFLGATTSSDSDFSNIFQDDELRVVIDVTKGGSDTSCIFPAFSKETLGDEYSMDGMEEELQALENLGSDLRRELEVVDCVPSKLLESSSEESLDLTYSATDEEDTETSTGTADSSIKQRRVHFSTEEDEYFYFSDDTSSQESPESAGDLQVAWENFYMVCEELIDELTLACSRAIDHDPICSIKATEQPAPPTPPVQRRSTTKPAAKRMLRRSSFR